MRLGRQLSRSVCKATSASSLQKTCFPHTFATSEPYALFSHTDQRRISYLRRSSSPQFLLRRSQSISSSAPTPTRTSLRMPYPRWHESLAATRISVVFQATCDSSIPTRHLSPRSRRRTTGFNRMSTKSKGQFSGLTSANRAHVAHFGLRH